MTVVDQSNNNKIIRTKNVLVGIRFDGESREVLSWALVKVAEPGDSVIAIHVCRNSDHAIKKQPLLDDYLDVYQGLCSVKKVELTGQILIGSSVRKVLVREAKNYTDVTLVLGISKKSTFGTRGSTSLAKYCAKRLSSTTDVLAVHNGKILFTSCTSNQPPGLKGDPKPSLCNPKEAQSEFGDSECDTETVISVCEPIRFSQDGWRHGRGEEDSRSESFSIVNEESRGISRSASVLSTDSYYSNSSFMDQRPGWPLLRKAVSGAPQTPKYSRNVSVVQWVMSLPDRSPLQSFQCSTISEDSSPENETNDIVSSDYDVNSKIKLASFGEVPQQGLRSLIEANSSGCKWFSLDLLKASTSQFSSERLIGKGGCNRVYKGILRDGKPVAVKILKSSKQGWRDFALEFDIISSVKHRCIAPLLGICVEDNVLMSVYDFLSKGNLEENLHGKDKDKDKGKDKSVLSWEVRYDIAVGIAEALYYLHNECPQQVIHRDIKSSNILLSDGFEPKLSDFGLAMWGPETSGYLTEGDVVGTFGYLAPEYFMYGKVSDKIDVYAFGVVLLELLSGRRPIGSHIATAKEQESLVMWAKPRMEKGDVKGMLDPNLNGKVDEVQMHRMALAAALCITRSARLRPSIGEILKLLKGDEEVEKWASPKRDYHQWGSEKRDDDDNNNDDEVYPNSSAELHLGVAFNGIDDDSTSFSSSTDRSNTLSLEDYFKGRWSRSSSFD